VMQIDSQLHAKPYAGKVLEEVVRDKTPHELWLERKKVFPVCPVLCTTSTTNVCMSARMCSQGHKNRFLRFTL